MSPMRSKRAFAWRRQWFRVVLAELASLLLAHAAMGAEPASPDDATASEAPPDSVGADVDEARTHYRRGIALYDEGDYRLALVEFQRAYDIGKSPKSLYNLGQVYFQLANYAKARLTFEQYLREGGSTLSEERRKEVENDLASLRLRTAVLSVRANVADAEVLIDGTRVGKAPIVATVVNAGTLHVEVQQRGYATRTTEITLVGGDEREVDLELTKMTPDVVLTQTNRSGLPAVAVASWVVTGVLTAGAVGTGLFALSASSKYDSQRDAPISGSPAEARSDLEHQRNVVRGLALTTDILVVSAAAAAGASLYFTLRPRPQQPESPQIRMHGLGVSFAVGF